MKTDTLMHNSPLSCQTWMIAIYLMTTSIKGVSSMKLHRDLGITQKSAWFLAHRIREHFAEHGEVFFGSVYDTRGAQLRLSQNSKLQPFRVV